MPPRKRISHAKSRGGCTNCKKRHIKCDEQGPPCANCIARENAATCLLPTRAPVVIAQADRELVIRNGTSSNSSSSGTGGDPPGAEFQVVGAGGRCKQGSILLVPIAPDLIASSCQNAFSTRLMDLELLHRWTTSTYSTICTIPEDVPNMTLFMPRLGLRYTFLLHGILSMAALEASLLAESSTASRAYLSVALSYYGDAGRRFRQYLSHPRRDPELLYSLYMFSALIVGMNMAIPLCCAAFGWPIPFGLGACQHDDGTDHDVMRQKIMELFELQTGMVNLALSDYEGFSKSPYGPALAAAQRIIATASTKGLGLRGPVLEKVGRLLEAIPDGARKEALSFAFQNLKFCFLEEERGEIKGLFMAFMAMAGRPFHRLFQQGDSVASLIYMHWGTLVHELGLRAWWVTGLGRSVVDEMSKDLVVSLDPVAIMPEWWDSIVWARTEVGLEGLPVMPDMSLNLEAVDL